MPRDCIEAASSFPCSRKIERVLFIGSQFSNLYTTVDTPAEAAWNDFTLHFLAHVNT